MSYVGNTPALKYVNFAVQHFSTSATASYTLDQSVSNEVEIALFINNVRQEPGSSYAYTATGTALTLSQATAGSDTMYCIFIGKAVETNNPPAGSVNTSELVDNAVTTAKIIDNSITTAKIVNDAVTVDKLNLISTASVPSLEAKGTSGVTEGYIQLNCAENTHGIKIKSPPHSASASYTLTMPTTDGNSSQFLQTNGSGVLTWAEAGGGKVLQVVSAIKTDRVQTTSTSATTTGLSVAITPSATNSKILLLCNIGSAGNSGNNNRTYFAFNGGNTATFLGNAATGQECAASFTTHRADYGQSSANMMYLDIPNTTSATTYSLYFWGDTGTTTLNGSHTVNAENGNAASSITAIEIGA